MKKKINKLLPARVKKSSKQDVSKASSTDLDVPRITNETVAEHRDEVLKGARKYIYPLQHSKHKVVLITTGILIATALIFLTYCVYGLYRQQDYNAFFYRVTQVVPFPVARNGKTLVAYENYLFELRRSVHYYETQLESNFKSEKDKPQLEKLKKDSLDQVINDAYINMLADENDISVSDDEVADRIKIVREQNRLGSNDRVFEDVLEDFWGWSVRDFERSVRQQILTEKVVAKLDTETQNKAASTLSQIQAGGNFAELAKQVSDDPSAKQNGGEYGINIDKSNKDIAPQVMEELLKLQPGQVSGVINTGQTLEIVKVTEKTGDTIKASHITFRLKDPSVYINDQKAKKPLKVYIKT